MRGAIDVKATGSAITTGAASASKAVDNNAAGVRPTFIRVAATAAAYVKVGPSTVTAAAGDLLVQPGDAVVLKLVGATHVAAVQVTASGIVQISPMEDSM